jgi:hypothetical protein
MIYEGLLQETEKEGIDIIELKFKGKSKGLYGDNVIAISEDIETIRERQCILAEELGHHYTSYGDILDKNNIVNIKQEKRARNWAYERLVGIIGLINAYKKGIRDKHELADYLGVTEEFLEEAINHYKEKYGLYYKIDNYAVYFDPLGILEIF